MTRWFGDWNLRHCARHGHVTYRPDEPELAATLHAATPLGDAWRCLRCGTYVLGPPAGAGPADRAPEVPRGRLLRDRVLMRLLAVERFARALLLALGAVAVWQFGRTQATFADLVAREIPLLRPAADAIGWDIDQSWIARTVRDIAAVSSSTLHLVVLALVAYSAVQIAEGVGLWSGRRWGEYLAVVATSAFIPLEVYELVHHATAFKVAALALNVTVVVWLVWSKRLFGVRGGHAAFLAEHATESFLTVERAARTDEPSPSVGTRT